MLGRQAIGDARGILHILDKDDGAIVAPARLGNVLARQRGKLARDGHRDLIGEVWFIGNQDGLGRCIMFGLCEQVCCDPIGIA